jgi:hypothetical protein
MARVRLDRPEAENGYLPPVCMRCGAPATCQRRQNFKYSATGTVVNTWIIAPLCNAHRGHFSLRNLAVPLVLIMLGIAFCGSFFAVPHPQGDHTAANVIFVAGGIGFVGWIVMSAVLHYTSIRLRTFEFGSLELAGVAPEFAASLVQHRQSPKHETPLALQGAGKSRRHIRLGRGEADGLPAICICCGEPATDGKETVFRERLNAELNSLTVAGVLSANLLVGILHRSDRNTLSEPWHLRLPVCRRHRSYWAWRHFIMFASFLLLVGGLFLWVYLNLGSAGWLCVGGFIGFLVWAALAIYLQETMIQPVELTDETLALKFVSERFVDAVEQRRRRGGPPR